VVIGRPAQEVRHAMEVAVAAQIAAMEAMRPGTPGSEVEGAARQVVEAGGLEKYFLYSGVHSVGDFPTGVLSVSGRSGV
jgi:Xaa-Pro aminopeptidase